MTFRFNLQESLLVECARNLTERASTDTSPQLHFWFILGLLLLGRTVVLPMCAQGGPVPYVWMGLGWLSKLL